MKAEGNLDRAMSSRRVGSAGIWFLRLCSVLAVIFMTSLEASALTSIALQWSANTEPDLAGYRLQYGIVTGTTNGPVVATVDVANVTQYRFTGLPDARYWFAGQAYDTLGQSSEWSAAYVTPAIPKTMGGLKVTRIELVK